VKLRRFLLLGIASVLLLAVFTVDVIRRTVDLDIGSMGVLRNAAILAALFLVFRFLESVLSDREHAPVKRIGLMLLATGGALVVSLTLTLSVPTSFDVKRDQLIPLDFGSIFVSSILGVSLGVFAVFTVQMFRRLLLYKPRKGTRRNLLILLAAAAGAIVSASWLDPGEGSVLTSVLFGVAALFAVVTSFRQPWIVYLTKREKLFTLVYSFLLFLGFLGLNVLAHQEASGALRYWSLPATEGIWIAALFGNIYFGMTFISTLFHLPTAEAFERKASEVSSLHALSRLVTQVFDFDELADSVTGMTLQVSEAQGSWLEIIAAADEQSPEGGGPAALVGPGPVRYAVRVAATKNIAEEEIHRLVPMRPNTLRDAVVGGRTPLIVDDTRRDSRFGDAGEVLDRVRSIIAVPLVSHRGLIGVLYATKSEEYGFFADDAEMISAFADQATLAIENSRLIAKSLERERLQREMDLAQEMQRKLLPQTLPRARGLDIDAVSTPAQEVGGDYYDFVELAGDRLGVAVGDVSGKGVSAAFYMSEVKGIFQALSRMYPSPREFMVHANRALSGSIDNFSFVSLLYAVLDLGSGALTLARAGHTPLLHVRANGDAAFLRPSGMGMGMSEGCVFADTMEEATLRLATGDVCVLYTDGVTEARRGDEEFGYDRLLDRVRELRDRSAADIKRGVLEAVDAFTDRDEGHDDVTLVVIKWTGGSGPGNDSKGATSNE
jgi:serine phosphatase RsbU (regulator of sigma subunit)